MNRQQTKELLPIIQAFAEGKTIQSKWIDGTWNDIDNESINNIIRLKEYRQELRIKPESKYRPFANNKECWNEMLKHKPFGWLKDDVIQLYNIINIKTTGITVNNGISNCNYSFKNVFNLTFADGTPFGVEE